jgi:hypothetical protein
MMETLHNEALHYSSFNIFTVIKERRLKLARHVARMGLLQNALELVKGKYTFETYIDVYKKDFKVCLKGMCYVSELSWFKIGPNGRLL